MNERLAGLLEDLPLQAIDAYHLSEERHPAPIVEALEKMRAWAGIVADGLVVNRELVGVLLSRGREGLLRLFEAYTAETMRTEGERAEVYDCLQRLCRQAKNMRLIPWSLDGIRPEAPTKAKIFLLLERDTDERLRAAAGARGETLSAFVEDSVRERLGRIAARPRRRPATKSAARTETATA